MRRPAALFAAGLVLSLCSCRRSSTSDGPYTISVPYDLATLDPGAKNRLSDFSLLSNLYEPLVVTDANLSPRPALAVRWRNPDTTTWLFELRPGVRFHDGRPLTAEDVVWTFQRLREGRDLEMAGHVSTIQGVRALGERTVEIRTAAPVGIFLNKLRFVLVVRRGEDSSTLRARVNGTGPYRLASWEKGVSMAFSRNDAYWGTRPALASVKILLNRTPDIALADFLSGRSSFIQSNAKRTGAALAGESGVELRHNSSVSVKFLYLDLHREVSSGVEGGRNPFRDVRVRRAVSLGVDRVELVRRLSAPSVPANQLVTPYIFGHDPARGTLPYDPGEARRLLAEAGWPNGFAVDFPARGLFGEAALVVSEMLGRIGIRARVAVLPEQEWFRTMDEGLYSLTISRFGCPTGDASDLFENLLQTRNAERKAGLTNYSRYSNPELDRLVTLAAGTLEMSRRKAFLVEATAKVMDDLPIVPLYIDQDVYAFRPGVAWRPRNDNFLIASEITRGR